MENTRDQLVEKLKIALNKKHDSELSFDQVSSWVGSDDEDYQIQTYIDEVETSSFGEVIPKEIIDYNQNS